MPVAFSPTAPKDVHVDSNKQAIAVTEELGQLTSVAENLRELHKHIKSIRLDAQRNVSKTGPDD